MGYPGIGAQLWIQTKAVLLVMVWTAVVSFMSFYIVKLTVGLRVTEEQEREGLDITLARRAGVHGLAASRFSSV